MGALIFFTVSYGIIFLWLAATKGKSLDMRWQILIACSYLTAIMFLVAYFLARAIINVE